LRALCQVKSKHKRPKCHTALLKERRRAAKSQLMVIRRDETERS
jgi:hypothetical protein